MRKLITPYAAGFGKPNVVIKHFPDDESYVLIPRIESLKNEKVLVMHSLYPHPDKRIFELLLILARLKKETKNIEIFIPYLPYARQDRENKKGETVSADVLCSLLAQSGVKKLITYDCHFLAGPGKFVRQGLTIENLSAGKILVDYAKKYFAKESSSEKFLVISPDEGASYFTENAQGHSLKKTRKSATKIHKMEGDFNIGGKNICILDDIIATGGTIIHAIGHLKKQGAKKIIVGATHGVFAKEGIEKAIIKAGAKRLFTTNSILSENPAKFVHILKLD